jgi:hypothetical protein
MFETAFVTEQKDSDEYQPILVSSSQTCGMRAGRVYLKSCCVAPIGREKE